MSFDFKQWTVSYTTCECGCTETLQLVGSNESWLMNWCTNCGSLLMKDVPKQQTTVIRPKVLGPEKG